MPPCAASSAALRYGARRFIIIFHAVIAAAIIFRYYCR
jgi:hypothetical protein